MSGGAGGGASPKSPVALFGAFNRLALQGFGGVLPVAQRELCEHLQWLTREQFLELLSVAQVLPGPNIVNLALIFGDRLFGWRGAAAAASGVLAAPLAIVLALALLAQRFQGVIAVGDALRGMGVVAAGLVLSTALRLAGGLRRNGLGRPTCAAYIGLTAISVGWLHWPLLPVVLGLGSSAFALALARLPR
ncbi:MAG: chromate transporter [Burkholderiales bacterium]|nr:chromate transporter [Burkholderiales bacterium]